MTNNKQLKIRNPKKEKFVEAIVRWWGAGAVYFFIGWGTGLGSQSDPLDFIFILGFVAGLVTIVVLDPLIYGMLDIERKDGELYNKKYFDRTILQNVYIRSIEIIKAMIIVIFVFISYNLINMLLIQLLNLSDTIVPLPGEPISFGILYIIFYYLIRYVVRLFKKIKGK
jgi:hypothetical protein